MTTQRIQSTKQTKERLSMELIRVKRNYQLTIPARLRRQLKLAVGDYVEADVQNGKIVIQPVEVAAPAGNASQEKAKAEAYAALEEIWAKTKGEDPEEIEALVAEAVREVRNKP